MSRLIRSSTLALASAALFACAEPATQPLASKKGRDVPAAAPANFAAVTDVIGPVFATLPGGASFTSAGDPGRAGGKTWSISATDPSLFGVLAWGKDSNDPITATTNGTVDTPGETLAFDLTSSNLSTGLAVWTGSTTISTTSGVLPVYLRFELQSVAASFIDADSPIAQTFGIPAGAEVVTPASTPTFDINFVFLASLNPGGPWTPILDFYDNQPTSAAAPLAEVKTSFSGAFYYTKPNLVVSPNPLGFGNQTVGITSGNVPVTLSNTGNAPVSITATSLTGANAANFSVASSTCGATIAPAASCAVNFNFTPPATGPRGASYNITADKQQSASVALSGNGVLPTVSLSAGNMTFGDQITGTTSASQSVTVTNTGAGVLIVSAVTTTGANAADFAVTSSTCTAGPITPGNTCQINGTFTPTAVGSRTATVNIASNAPSTPNAIALSGVGISPSDVSVGVAADPNPAHAGKTLTYTITVKNNGPAGATGVQLTDVLPSTVSFASIAPAAGVTCVTPPANAAGSVICNVGSMASGASKVITLVVNTLSGAKNFVDNTVSITSTSTDPIAANNTATISTAVYGKK